MTAIINSEIEITSQIDGKEPKKGEHAGIFIGEMKLLRKKELLEVCMHL